MPNGPHTARSTERRGRSFSRSSLRHQHRPITFESESEGLVLHKTRSCVAFAENRQLLVSRQKSRSEPRDHQNSPSASPTSLRLLPALVRMVMADRHIGEAVSQTHSFVLVLHRIDQLHIEFMTLAV